MSRKGFSLLELTIAIGIMAIIASAGSLLLTRSRASSEVKTAGIRVTALLRQAQQSAIQRASSTSWGVRFDNTTTTAPSVVMFASSTYATSSVVSTYALSSRVRFATSSIAAGATRDIVFAVGTGYPTATSSIVISAITGTTTVTISVSEVGVITVSRADIPSFLAAACRREAYPAT